MIKIVFFSSDTRNNLDNQDDEYKYLQILISSSKYDIELIHIPSTKLEDIIDTLNTHKPHIVHFSGHGNSDAKLEIFDKSGYYDEELSADTLRRLFETIKSVRFIFFNTCYSKSFAKPLLSEIDYLLVMNDKITNKTAKDISKRFYKSFLENLNIEDSFKQLKVSLNSNDEKNIPELLKRDDISDIHIENITNPNKSYFIKKVFEELSDKQIILLLSQDFTDTTEYIREIRDIGKKKSDMCFYHFDTPSEDTKKKEFISTLSLCLDENSKTFNEFKCAMKKKLESLEQSHQKLFLFITNFERGKTSYTKELAYIIRDLKLEKNFYTIIIGGYHLASMRYENGELSPLNNAKEIFFPPSKLEDRSKIILGFSKFHKKYKKELCQYLNGKDLGSFSTWSSSNLINRLFWRNLIVDRDKKFVWKSKTIQDIGKEYIECID